MSKEKLVPKLRFEEFENTDEWEEEVVTDLCSVSTGSSNTEDNNVNGKYPFYVRSATVQFSNKYLYDEEAVLTVGDGVGTGKVFHYVNEKYDLHQRVYRMYNFKNNILGKYFYFYFSKNFYDRVMAMSAKTSVDSVRRKMITEMKISFPTAINEQHKITNFLKKIDKMIQLQQAKVKKIKDIKSAYLSEMFPKEGEKYPEKRFEGFQGTWEKIKLEEVFSQSGSGGTPRTTEEDYYGGNIPFLGISDITNSNGYIYDTEKKITAEGLNNSAAWLVPEESISLAMYASVGKVAILRVESATSQAFYNMVIKNQSTRDYIYQYLVKMETENMWDKIISTGTQANLNAEKVRSLIIPIPIDIEERGKIGRFFKNLDNQISIEEEKLNKLEKLKEGYLKDMFV